MKHSSSSPMSDSNVVSCDGKWNCLLKKLYVDVFNLIVESRMPGINERGYGDGSHCPPIKGSNSHLCDLSKSECQSHQRLIHHLLKAVSHNVFEIEVLMLPDCCNEIKLSERLKSKEYILLERWSMKCTNGKTQSAIEISELLRAVRSFLHFSQLSAWLSLTKGKSPSNIYYWVKPSVDFSSTTFETSSKAHLFPVCRVSDGLQGIIKVDFLPRKQYIPIIPCSKHPPLHELAFRTINEDSSLTKNIPLNSEIVKQLQKTCERQQSIIIKHSGSSSDPFVIAPVSVVKTVTKKVSDSNKVNKLFKHSNSQLTAQNILNLVSKSSFVSQVNKINVSSSNSETAYVCKCTSQENICLNEKSLNIPLSRKDSPLSILNEVLVPSLCELNSNSVEAAHQMLPQQNAAKDCDINSELCSDVCVVSDTSNLLLQNVESSQSISSKLYNCHSYNNNNSAHQICSKPMKHLKRKHSEQDKSECQSSKKTLKIEKRKKLKSTELLFANSMYQNGSLSEIEKSRQICHSSKKSKKRALSFQGGNSAKKTCVNLGTEFSNSIEKSEETNICSPTSLSVNFSSIKKSASICNIPNAYSFCTALHRNVSPYFDCFPTHKLKFSKGRKLLLNFEESILKGCLPPASIVKGFYAEIGASGSFCPNHLTLPADVCFYELDSSSSGATPYVAHVTLDDSEYYLPKKGAVQVTLFNPSETVVKMFVINYDFTNMPPLCHTFIRQKTYSMPKGSTEENQSSQKWLRFIVHLRFASSKSGKVYLHKDLKIVVLNKSNDDAASEFSQEPRELCSFLHVPMNPTYSNL